MKKLISLVLFVLIGTAGFSQKRQPSWNVYNSSIISGCPYEVCFYMELRYTNTNTPVPASNIMQCQTIQTGSSANFYYPASVASTMTIVVTSIQVNIGPNSYPLAINPVGFEIINDACSALNDEACRTYWNKTNVNQYYIQGNCLVGN